jgi:hypothetical protein
MKVFVRIKTPSGEKSEKHKVENDGQTIIMSKDKKKKPLWILHFKNLLVREKWFGLSKNYYLDTFYEADQAIEYDTQNKAMSPFYWDRSTAKKFVEVEVIRNRGRGTPQKSPTILLIIALLCSANLIVLLAWLMGLLRFQVG